MATHPGSAGVHFSKEDAEGQLLVEGYGAGSFRLQGRRVSGTLYVNGQGYWPIEAASLDAMVDADLDRITGGANSGDSSGDKPELLLVGTGKAMTLLPRALRQRFEREGLPYDAMDTGAAARTYNVLLLEGRKVAALMLPVD